MLAQRARDPQLIANTNVQAHSSVVCGACGLIMSNPTRGVCSHVFCESCFHTAVTQSGCCPLCQRTTTPHQLKLDLLASHAVEELEIVCPSGCGVVLKLCNIGVHELNCTGPQRSSAVVQESPTTTDDPPLGCADHSQDTTNLACANQETRSCIVLGCGFEAPTADHASWDRHMQAEALHHVHLLAGAVAFLAERANSGQLNETTPTKAETPSPAKDDELAATVQRLTQQVHTLETRISAQQEEITALKEKNHANETAWRACRATLGTVVAFSLNAWQWPDPKSADPFSDSVTTIWKDNTLFFDPHPAVFSIFDTWGDLRDPWGALKESAFDWADSNWNDWNVESATDWNVQPATDWGDQPTTDRGDQPTTDRGDQPATDWGDQSTTNWSDQPTRDRGDQPTTDRGDQSITDRGDQPATECSSKQPASDRTVEQQRFNFKEEWALKSNRRKNLDLAEEMAKSQKYGLGTVFAALIAMHKEIEQVKDMICSVHELAAAGKMLTRVELSEWGSQVGLLSNVLFHLTELTELVINDVNLSPEGYSRLGATISHLSKLTLLDLSRTRFDLGSIKFSNLSELTSLDLSRNNLHSLDPLAKVRFFDLTTLDLSNNNLGQSDLTQKSPFVVVRNAPRLTYLDISGNDLGTHVESWLLEYSTSNLVHLNLARNNLGAIRPQLLAECLTTLKALQHLDLSGNLLKPAFASHLRNPLGGLPNLQTLLLSGNEFGTGDVKVIGNLLKNLPALTTLDLGVNKFTETQVEELKGCLAGLVYLSSPGEDFEDVFK